jgi:GNAT superfamily N-acetyltransferase
VSAYEIALRPMAEGDIDDGLRLCRASGWNQTARDWQQFLDLTPGGAAVAERDGRVIATVATMRYGGRFAWIGMVLVDPAERGRGVGTRMLEEGLALVADLPLAGLDATPAGHPLYVRHGFREEYGLVRMQCPARLGLRSSADGVRPMTAADLAGVIAYDERVFGAGRAPMLRWMLEGAPELAWVALAEGRVSGYTFGRRGHLFWHVGPIVADDEHAAATLLDACLAAPAGGPYVVDVPRRSGGWLKVVAELGFTEQRPLTRMSRGVGRLPGHPERLFAILGPEFG